MPESSKKCGVVKWYTTKQYVRKWRNNRYILLRCWLLGLCLGRDNCRHRRRWCNHHRKKRRNLVWQCRAHWRIIAHWLCSTTNRSKWRKWPWPKPRKNTAWHAPTICRRCRLWGFISTPATVFHSSPPSNKPVCPLWAHNWCRALRHNLCKRHKDSWPNIPTSFPCSKKVWELASRLRWDSTQWAITWRRNWIPTRAMWLWVRWCSPNLYIWVEKSVLTTVWRAILPN